MSVFVQILFSKDVDFCQRKSNVGIITAFLEQCK